MRVFLTLKKKPNKKHDKENFQHSYSEVKLKKYFYVLRPLHCISWMDDHGGLPPVRFEDTLAQIDIPGDVKEEVVALVHKKRTSTLGEGRRIRKLDEWIAQSFSKAGAFCEKTPESNSKQLPDIDDFDRLFFDTVMKRHV